MVCCRSARLGEVEAVLALSGRQPQLLLLHNRLAGVVRQLEIVGAGHHAGQVVVRVHLHHSYHTLQRIMGKLRPIRLSPSQNFVSSKHPLYSNNHVTETHLGRVERFLHDGERRRERLERPDGEARTASDEL